MANNETATVTVDIVNNAPQHVTAPNDPSVETTVQNDTTKAAKNVLNMNAPADRRLNHLGWRHL